MFESAPKPKGNPFGAFAASAGGASDGSLQNDVSEFKPWEAAMKAMWDKMSADMEKKKTADRLDTEAKAEMELYAKDHPKEKLSPEAAFERAHRFVDARNDLKGLFHIVADTTPAKDRKENELTDADFRKMAKTYSDIKAGDGDLTVDAVSYAPEDEKAGLKDKALRDVARILQTGSGRDLVAGLSNNTEGQHKHTTISSDTEGAANDTPDAAGNQTVKFHANSVIAIPGVSSKPEVGWANLIRSDIALYHELVHAQHNTKGDDATWSLNNEIDPVTKKPQAARKSVDPFDDNLDAKEYQATGLGFWGKGKGWAKGAYTENRYREERNNLTADGAYDDLALNQATKDKFPDWQKSWVDGKIAQRDKYNPEAPLSIPK